MLSKAEALHMGKSFVIGLSTKAGIWTSTEPETFCLFVCLEGLLRIDMVAILSWHMKRHSSAYSKPQSLLYAISEVRQEWDNFRNKIDAYRATSTALDGFVAEHSNTKECPDSCRKLSLRYAQHIQELELVGSHANDQINMMSSVVATEMAQISIKESKRVMLCKEETTMS